MNHPRNLSSNRWRKLSASILVATLVVAGGALALTPAKPEPVGATLTYVSTIKGVTIQILSAIDDMGKPFAHADADYSTRPEVGGATMGAAPVPYGLPQWVDFEWREPAYPGIVRGEGEPREVWRAKVREEYGKLARKRERVYVANKIPPGAIEEVGRSRAKTERGKLPDKMLWVYFVWTQSGIKVRWRVQRDHPDIFTEWQGEPLE